MKKSRFDFPTAVTAELGRIGAHAGGSYGWQLVTRAGVLEIHPYDTWVACCFLDVEQAQAQVSSGYLNRYSGKWNWHFVDPAPEDVAFFIGELKRLLPAQTAR